MSLRLAVATEDLDTNLRKAIGLATSLGVGGVRLNARTEIQAGTATESSLRQMRHYVHERQMSVAGLICPTRHSLHDPEYLEPRLEIIRKSMAAATKLSTNQLIVRCGAIPDPDSAQETSAATSANIETQANPFSFAPELTPATETSASAFARLVEVLTDLAEYGNHIGCILSLQLTAYNLPLTQRLLAEVTSGPLSVCLDTATAVRTGLNPDAVYRDFYHHIGYVRARDAIRDAESGDSEVRPGSGVVDWMQLMPTLSEADYSGWICVERTGGNQRLEDVRSGTSLLNRLIPETGD